MAQHFLLSAEARSLSLKAIFRMSDDEARATFKAIRWADNGGEPFCPRCGCLAIYGYASRQIWKCRECRHQFSVTSGTIFASRKLPIREYLAAIALFVNAVKGISALQLSRDLDIQYKSAYVLSHKLREAVGSTRSLVPLTDVVEIDGAFFGGHAKPANIKAQRKDRRLLEEQTDKRQVVVVARQRRGRTIPFVAQAESEGAALVRSAIATGTVVHADEAPSWDRLHAHYEMRRINHSQAYSLKRGLYQPSRKLFLSLATCRNRPTPSCERPVSGRLCR